MNRSSSSNAAHSTPVVVSALACLLLYLVWNTGIHSDDYPFIRLAETRTLRDILLPDLSAIHVLAFGPFSYYFDYLQYYFFGRGFLAGYDLVKFLTLAVGIALCYRFATDYLPRGRALLAAMLFFLYPVHDATVYWTATLIYALTPAAIMYAHHLIRQERFVGGTLLSAVGAFTTHASPPYTFGLGLIFLIERAYKKAALFMAPGLLYVVFYFTVSRLPGVYHGRIQPDLTATAFVKQYVLQIGSFLDAVVGPSFWLKLWYSVGSITLISLGVAVLAWGGGVKYFHAERAGPSVSLLGGLGAVALLAFAMFALTGLYPQMAFNLGNRVAVYGSLPIAFLLAMLPIGRRSYAALTLVFLVVVLGLSDHWKGWNARQQEVFTNIRTNAELARLGKSDVLLVAGHAYSRLGPISHIEFFSEDYMADSLFRHALGHEPPFTVHSVNRRYHEENGYLVDRKHGTRIPLGREVVIYDAEKNAVTRLPVTRLGNYLTTLPPDIRHWVQLLGDGWLKSTILALMPRLRYAFEQ